MIFGVIIHVSRFLLCVTLQFPVYVSVSVCLCVCDARRAHGNTSSFRNFTTCNALHSMWRERERDRNNRVDECHQGKAEITYYLYTHALMYIHIQRQRVYFTRLHTQRCQMPSTFQLTASKALRTTTSLRGSLIIHDRNSNNTSQDQSHS